MINFIAGNEVAERLNNSITEQDFFFNETKMNIFNDKRYKSQR